MLRDVHCESKCEKQLGGRGQESPRQTKPKQGPKRKVHMNFAPIFLCEFWCFSLGKQARFTSRTFVPECPCEKFMNGSFFGLVCRGHSWRGVHLCFCCRKRQQEHNPQIFICYRFCADGNCRPALSGGLDWWRMEWPFLRVRKIFFGGRNFQEKPGNSAERAIWTKFQGLKFENSEPEKCNDIPPAIPYPH